MEEMRQITLDEWLSWKEDIREKLRETAGNFVHIGFRLKQIRDSGMFGGAADIFEFAKKEYGLGKSTTSRFIAINERFSEGGNSLELRREYKALGSSKLSEMLTLTDAECQMITERTTVAEIREYKSFLGQPVPEEEPPEETGEQQAAEESEWQQAAEGTSAPQEPESGEALPEGGRKDDHPEPEGSTGRLPLTPLQKCMEDFFRCRDAMLNLVVPAVHEGRYKDAVDRINPFGHYVHKKGICFLSMEDYSRGVKVKLLTEPSTRSMTWEELLDEVYAIYKDIYESGVKDVHGAYYNPPKEEKSPERLNAEAPVATSQQEEKPDTEEPESKPGKASVKTKKEKPEAAGAVEPAEEPLPGQVELSDYPGVVPEIPDASYEEIASVPAAEVSEPEETAQAAGVPEPEETNLAAGMTEPAADVPGLAGMDPAAGKAEPAAGAGKKPSAVDKTLAWMEFENHLSYLKQWPAEWNYDIVPNASLRHAYQEAIGLAAALEKIMDMKGVSNV